MRLTEDVVGHDEIKVQGLSRPIEVRRHPAARRLTLRVSQTRRAVILTVPTTCGRQEAGRFVTRNLAWLRSRLADLPPGVPFEEGALVPLRGVEHVVRFREPQRGGGVVRALEGDERIADGLPVLEVAGLGRSGARRLRDWLQAEARRDVSRAVGFHARNLGLQPRRITVRDQTTRWGSCSSGGALSFSWRLILAPRFVLSYVAAHEVAHLQEMNHGPRFWALVRMTMPRLDEAQAWLREHGARLHSIGCESEDGAGD